MFTFSVWAKSQESSDIQFQKGQYVLVGYVEAEDYSEAMQLSRYHANKGEFDNKKFEYTEDDIVQVCLEQDSYSES